MLNKKKLNVWVLQTGEPLIIDGNNQRLMRGMNLANKLVERGHKVLFFSSAFNHQKKLQRTFKNKKIIFNSNLSFYLIASPGYKKNISIKRFYDHFVLAINLRKILAKNKEKPDIVFIGYPPIEISYVMSKWLTNKKIPYILDVKDQWPDLIVEVFPKQLQYLIKLILYPYYYCVKKTINNSSSITSMSESFINWSIKISKNKNVNNNQVLPLVSNKKHLDQKKIVLSNDWCDKNKIFVDSFNILFVGSISRSFDFETLIDCAKKIKNNKVKFIICGDGELRNDLIEKSYNIENIIFPGWVDNEKIESIALRSSIAIAPYKNYKNFIDNIPNKIIDYLSYGLPILSPLRGEVESLIKTKQLGMSYLENSGDSLMLSINEIYLNKKQIISYSCNAKKLYNEQYSYDLVYDNAVNLVEKIYSENKKY